MAQIESEWIPVFETECLSSPPPPSPPPPHAPRIYIYTFLDAASTAVGDTQMPDDPSFIYVLGRFVLKVLYLSKHFIYPCCSVR